MCVTEVLVRSMAFATSFQHKHLSAERHLFIVLQETSKTSKHTDSLQLFVKNISGGSTSDQWIASFWLVYLNRNVILGVPINLFLSIRVAISDNGKTDNTPHYMLCKA